MILVFFVGPILIERRVRTTVQPTRVARFYRETAGVRAILGLGFATVFGAIVLLAILSDEWSAAAISAVAAAAMGGWGAYNRRG